MAYSKQTWQNGETGGTPLNAARLNTMEDGIEGAANDATQALATATSATGVANDAIDEAAAATAAAAAAQSSADAAQADATQALADAATADGKAVNAHSAANTAQAAADAAQEDATQALSDAADAQETADSALAMAREGGGGSGGPAPARYAHYRIDGGQVPANQDLKTRFAKVAAESSADLMTVQENNVLRVVEAGFYEFSVTVQSHNKNWSTGWTAVKNPGQTVIYATQDMPANIAAWTITGSAYWAAGADVFIQVHPGGSGNFLDVDVDVFISQVSATSYVGKSKHAEATYAYAVAHGTPFNAGLVPIDAATTDTAFVTWGSGNGLFTINETGVYAIDAIVSSNVGIGGTLGIGDANLTQWYGIADVGSEASSWIVPISNLYITAGTTMRYYYNPKQGVNSATKRGTVRITQIAAALASPDLPRGIVGWARRTTYTGSIQENVQGGGAAKPWLRLDVNLTPGRTYEISTSSMRIGSTAGTDVQISLSYKCGGIATVYDRTFLSNEQDISAQDGDHVGPLIATLPVAPGADPKHSFLIEAVVLHSTSSTNQAGLRPSSTWPLDLYVKDVGPYREAGGVICGPGPDDNPAWSASN